MSAARHARADHARRLRIHGFTVASSAAFAGANLFIGLSMGGYWLSLDPTEYLSLFFGQWLWFLATVMPLLLMTLYGLIASALLDRDNGALRPVWRRAMTCLVATCLITVAFHMPLNLRLGAATYTPEQAAASGVYPLLALFGAVTPESAGFTRALWLIGHAPRVLLAIAISWFAMQAAFAATNPSGVGAP